MADEESFEISGELSNSNFEDSFSGGLDSVVDSGSDIDAEAIGTEGNVADTADSEGGELATPKRGSLLSGFSMFDGMLVCALVLIVAASLMMLTELSNYGGLFGLPWKTTGITVK